MTIYGQRWAGVWLRDYIQSFTFQLRTLDKARLMFSGGEVEPGGIADSVPARVGLFRRHRVGTRSFVSG